MNIQKTLLTVAAFGLFNFSGIANADVKCFAEHCLITQGQPCDYCFRSCPKSIGAITKDEDGLPVISEDLCIGCGKCEYICVSMSGKAIVTTPI